jgi:hypothetical protein
MMERMASPPLSECGVSSHYCLFVFCLKDGLFSTDELFKSSAFLTDAFLFDPSLKHSQLLSAAPFNLAFNTKRQFFNWLEEDSNQLRLKRFGRAMMSTAGWEDGGGASQADGILYRFHLLSREVDTQSQVLIGEGYLSTASLSMWAEVLDQRLCC